MKFTIGCDPEIFLINKDKKPISAVGLIGGNKWQPRPIDNQGHAILEDNVSVEFNIAPAHDQETFLKSIRMVMDHIQMVVGHDLQFTQQAAISFPKDQLNTPEALLFGCEPDFDAWTEQVNMKPYCKDKTLRSAGGHIHIGTELPVIPVIRAMDLHAGVPSTLLDNSPASKKRRQLYGKAGCHRPKPYGCEYRTLSNFWIFTDELVHWAYTATQRALEFVAAGNEISPEDGDMIQRCINDDDDNARQYLMKRYAL